MEKKVRSSPCSVLIMRRLFALFFTVIASSSAFATNVIMETPFGDVEIELFDEQTPQTVANFLNYVNRGDYTGTFVHRSVPGFVVQGGGFTYPDGTPIAIPSDPPVVNEPGISNLRGTIAMAKLGGDPNSATNQWFFNVEDNSADLDNQNGGFTVFGQVVGNGMDVIDTINQLQIWNAGAPFNELPLIDYPGTGPVLPEHLVLIVIDEKSVFNINAGLNDAWFNPATPGQGFFITVFPDIEQLFLAWFTFDTERPEGPEGALLGDPFARWLTAFGSFENGTAELAIEVTQGGVFDAAAPIPTQSQDGTITLEFSDCENGTVTYDIPSADQQGVIPIQRIALDNVAGCEQLAVGQQ